MEATLSDITTLATGGLQTDPGPWSGAPDGALVEAHNVVCERRGLIEPRGPIATTQDAALASYHIQHGHQVEGQPLRTWSESVSGPGVWLMRRGQSTTISGPTNFVRGRVQSDYVKGRLLFTSEDGVCESPQGSDTVALRAGLPQPSMPWGYVSTGAWLANGQSVAYRFTISRTRPDGTTMESAPTAPFIVRNTSGSAGGVTFIPLPGLTYVPWDVGSAFDVLLNGDMLNVYRSPVLASATGTPSDVMRLRASLPLTGGAPQPFNDLLADADWNGPLLYTSSTRDGLLYARMRPSYARDICTYNGMTLYAGAKGAQRVTVTCKAIGDISADPQQALCTKTITVTTTSGSANLSAISAGDAKYLAPGQWITLNYGAGGQPGSADARFQVDTQIATVNVGAGTATLTKTALATGAISVTVWDWISVTSVATTFRVFAQEGANTSISDRRFLQSHSSGGNRMGGYQDLEFRWNNAATRIKDVVLHAFGADEVGGLPEFRNVSMTWERSSPLSGAFTVRSCKPDAFNRVVDSVTGIVSTQDGGDARVAISTPDIPDAGPIGQFVDIGDLSSPIYRIVPSRSSVLVIKGDGIYQLFGSSPSALSVTLLDGTVAPPRYDVAAGWIVKHGDVVYMMSSRGPVAITDAGVRPFGEDIYESLREQFGPGFAQVSAATACAAGSAPATPCVFFAYYQEIPYAPAYFDVIYVYNVETDAWTTWSARRPCTALWTGANGAQAIGLVGGHSGTYRDDRTAMLAPITASSEPLTGDTGRVVSISTSSMGGGRWSVSKAPTDDIRVGDVLRRSGVVLVVERVVSATVVEAVASSGADPGSGNAELVEGYPVRIVWTSRVLGQLAREKRYVAVTFAFALRRLLLRLNAHFQDAYAPDGVQTTVAPQVTGGWESSSSAETAQSLLAAPDQITVGVPLDVVRDWGLRVGFEVRQAMSWFSLGAVIVDAQDGGERVGRVAR